MSNFSYTWHSENIDPRKGGYSDLRLWPCYMALALVTLFLAPWWGTLGAFVVGGVPVFMLCIHLMGLTRSESTTIPKRWQLPVESEVYSSIRRKDEAFKQQNRLLRRNMKIIQEEEAQHKQIKKRAIKGRTRTV